MPGKCVVVCVWRRSQWAELVSGRLSLVYYRCGDSGGDAVFYIPNGGCIRTRSCFKFAALSFFPFGKEVQYGGGAGSFLLNIIWLIVSGLPLALEHLALGTALCVTIIGIPFGLQQFKLAKLALMPFGAEVY